MRSAGRNGVSGLDESTQICVYVHACHHILRPFTEASPFVPHADKIWRCFLHILATFLSMLLFLSQLGNLAEHICRRLGNPAEDFVLPNNKPTYGGGIPCSVNNDFYYPVLIHRPYLYSAVMFSGSRRRWSLHLWAKNTSAAYVWKQWKGYKFMWH